MKRLLILLALLMICLPAHAEFDDMEDMDYWYEQLYILSEEIGCRPVGSEGEELAMAHIRDEFVRLGFSRDNGTLNEYDVPNSRAKDVEAILPAARSSAPDILIVCAHYDSAPPVTRDGETVGVAGTRDNASGVAGMLALAREFAALPADEDTELRFLAFTSEETGHQGSNAYAEQLTQDELTRIVGVFNLDLITVDIWLMEHVFSVDTLGMRTENGYLDGSEEQPAVNKVVRAIQAAMTELDYFDPAENGYSHCVPRHLGMSDHDAFHFKGVDAANIAFRGNEEEGGHWHPYMHEADDCMGDLDYERTHQALNIVYTALVHLAQDPSYGDEAH